MWHLVRAAVPFAAISGLQITIRQTDIILLGLLTDEAQVGLYRAALQGSMLITFGSQAANIVIAPHFARHNPSSGIGPLWALMRTSIFASLSVGIPGVVVFGMFGRELLSIVFGVQFAGAALPLFILSIANAVALFNGAVIPLLNMTGCEDDTLRVFAVAVIVTVILNIILILMIGMVGAATAALISTVVWSALLRRSARRRLQIDPFATIFSASPPQRLKERRRKLAPQKVA
jgi:O-antigen/teichoic acid export membrane protein